MKRAIAVATMVGALTLARIVTDDAISNAFLRSALASLAIS
jgi:hypothetical protein